MVKTPVKSQTATVTRSSTKQSATKPDSRGGKAKGLGSGKKLSERTPTTAKASTNDKKRKASDEGSPTIAKRSKLKASSTSASKQKKVVEKVVEIENLPEESEVEEEEVVGDVHMEEEVVDQEILVKDMFDEIEVRTAVARKRESPKKKKEIKVVVEKSSSPIIFQAKPVKKLTVVKEKKEVEKKVVKEKVVKEKVVKEKVVKEVKPAPSTVNDSDSEEEQAVANNLLGSTITITPRSSRSAPLLLPPPDFTPTKRIPLKKSPVKSSRRTPKATTSKAILSTESSEDEEVIPVEEVQVEKEEKVEEEEPAEEEESIPAIQDDQEMDIEELGEAAEEMDVDDQIVEEKMVEEKEEEEEEAAISISPSKTKSKTPIRLRSPSVSSSTTTSNSNSNSDSDPDSDSDDEGDGLQVEKPTEEDSPRSSRDPSPVSNESRASSEDPVGIRSSARARRLPVAQADIDNMPASLRSNLVGWHGDDSPSKSKTHSPKKSKSKPSSKSSKHRTEPTHTTRYPAKMLQDLLDRTGQVLSGHRLPEPEMVEDGFDEKRVENYPYVQEWKIWEKPMRYAMENVVRDGVGNCVIVLGPRGVGKSAMVDRGLTIVQNVYGVGSFICVRLNGLVQTTDRQALRTIARQLKSQGLVEEGGDYGSNAATMSTLLKMLEPANDPTAVADKPIIIILDEFDLFALHPRQSFLYCLLDIVQGNRRKAGMGVIGLSARTDCLSILEKRVRSRCQSQVYQMVYPNDFDKYLEHARSLLRADVIYWENKSEEQGEMAKEWNTEVKAFMKESRVKDYFERIWSLYGNNPAHLLSALSHMYQDLEWNSRFTSEPRWPPSLNEEIPDETDAMDDEEGEGKGLFIPRLHLDLLPKADEGGKRTSLIRDCSILELNVCVAAKHLRDDYDNTINLEMLYDAYKAHVQRRSLTISARCLSKSQFSFAFDHLRELEVFLPHTGKPSWFVPPSGGDTFKMYRFIPWASTIDDEIARRGSDAPTALVKWCKSWQN